MVVVMQVPRAVATRSVGENASPLPLLSVGASVAIFDCYGPCVASQCKSPVYLIEMLTMIEYATHCAGCHVSKDSRCYEINDEIPAWQPNSSLHSKQKSMKKKVTGKHLTKEAPRSPRIRVGGYAILGRTIDKCRALVAGNIGEYHFDCPLDN